MAKGLALTFAGIRDGTPRRLVARNASSGRESGAFEDLPQLRSVAVCDDSPNKHATNTSPHGASGHRGAMIRPRLGCAMSMKRSIDLARRLHHTDRSRLLRSIFQAE